MLVTINSKNTQIYMLSKSFFSVVLHLNMTFKYNSGRVYITLQKKKILFKRCPSRKKIDF
jgi:hypothetical protein